MRHWKLDANYADTTVVDDSANGNNGTFIDAGR
jgi:hypothetical protein